MTVRWMPVSASRRKFLVPALAFSFAAQGCAILPGSTVKPVRVEEVDERGISLDQIQKLRGGDPAASITDLLGIPADRRPSCVPGEVVWRYPIRAWNDMANSREVVPAALLRVTFDRGGTLRDWGFVDSSGGRPVPVRETVDEASRWFGSLSHAPPPIPPRIELATTLIRGLVTAIDVERVLGQWQPDLHCGNGGPVPIVRKTKTDSGSVWDWYVDRPSRLFVPPYYLVVSVDDTGSLIVWHFEGTYPGGRK